MAVSCADCPFYTVPPPPREGGLGTCRRFPQAVQKWPGEICGEHPAMAHHRAGVELPTKFFGKGKR